MNDIATIELTLSEAKKTAAIGTALERLLKNRDFKSLVLEGYLEQEAIRLVHAKAHPNLQGDGAQKDILVQIDAIGAFKDYLKVLEHKARMAVKAIEDSEESLEELRAEELV